jgi:hypothetical protein
MEYIDCNEDFGRENLIVGTYYHSKINSQDYYLIEVIVNEEHFNVVANIYELESLQVEVKNGVEITYPKYQSKNIVSIDIWSKYYFNTWNNDNDQYYHGDKSIDSIAEVMKEALKLGLEVGEIELR